MIFLPFQSVAYQWFTPTMNQSNVLTWYLQDQYPEFKRNPNSRWMHFENQSNPLFCGEKSSVLWTLRNRETIQSHSLPLLYYFQNQSGKKARSTPRYGYVFTIYFLFFLKPRNIQQPTGDPEISSRGDWPNLKSAFCSESNSQLDHPAHLLLIIHI